jgi:hypothetical protein
MECAGSFKFQHDTGKNLLKIHVFPLVVAPKVDDDGEGDDDNEGDASAPMANMTPEWLCAAATAETFGRMIDAKMPGWLHRKRCAQTLREFKDKLSVIENKMVSMQTLEPEEQNSECRLLVVVVVVVVVVIVVVDDVVVCWCCCCVVVVGLLLLFMLLLLFCCWGLVGFVVVVVAVVVSVVVDVCAKVCTTQESDASPTCRFVYIHLDLLDSTKRHNTRHAAAESEVANAKAYRIG